MIAANLRLKALKAAWAEMDHVNPLAEARWVRVMCDYCADPVWARSGGNCELENLPVSDGLIERLRAWARLYEDKSSSIVVLVWRQRRRFSEEGLTIAEAVKADASLVPAPKQRNTEEEKAAIKMGKSADEIWLDEPNKAAQKDTNARWTLKIGGQQRYRPDGTPLPMIAVPVFGYKSHITIDRRFGFIRAAAVTSAAEADGRVLRRVVTTDTQAATSGPTAHIARGATRNGWPPTCCEARSIAANPQAGRCRRRRPGPMARSPPSAPGSSTSSRIRKIASGSSSARSGWRAPRRN